MTESQLILATFFVAFLAGYLAGYGNAVFDQIKKRLRKEREAENAKAIPPTFVVKIESDGCNITWRKEDRKAYLAGMEDRKPDNVTIAREEK